jgi:Mor family transcriptional regulator
MSDSMAEQSNRNQLIRNAYANGMAVSDLAQQHDISWQRVYQILNSN